MKRKFKPPNAKMQHKPRKEKLRENTSFGQGGFDVTKQVCFSFKGVKLSFTPSGMLMWNALGESQKKDHAKGIQTKIDRNVIRYEYLTYEDEIGGRITKYIYVPYNFKPIKDEDIQAPKRHDLS